MSSPLESLVAELFHMIIERLGYAELARILRCSKCLLHRVEPFLYNSEAVHNEAMLWACKTGNLQTIRLATSYGACVSTVRVPKRPINFIVDSMTRKRHIGAFTLLLELGAGIGNEDGMQLKLMKLLSKKRETFLRCFLDAGLRSQARDRSSRCLSVISVIRCGGSVDIVRRLLDDGASLEGFEHIGGAILASPLSAAIMENSTSIFDLLIERGADINSTEEHYAFNKGVRGKYRYSLPLHVSVLAAALVMVKHGVTMMQRCLDNGADINRRFHQKPNNVWMSYSHHYTTPLLLYLDSIESWKPDTSLHPVDGLNYLLEHHAIIETPYHPIKYGPGHCIKPISTVERLLDKWGLWHLSEPLFFGTIEILVENGARYSTKRILTKYTAPNLVSNRQSQIRPFSVDILTRWREFVDLILKHRGLCDVNPETMDDRQTLDDLLNHVSSLNMIDSLNPGDLKCVTMDCLLKMGATINSLS